LIEQNNTIYDIKESIKNNDDNVISDFINNNETYNELEVNDENRNFLIARNIISGEEKLFSSASRMSHFLNFDSKALVSYIDFPRLIHGYHIRSFGNSYWQPCKEYVYREDSTPFKNSRPIKSVNIDTNEVKIYESLSEAARILGKDDAFRARIGKYVNKDKIFIMDDIKLKWYYLTINVCGEFINKPNIFSTVDGKKINKIIKITEKSFEYQLIVRNIKTSEEKYCKTIAEANRLVATSDISNYIDTDKHLKGFIIRSINAKKYWIPPDNFKYIEDYITMQKFYIKATNKATGEITYYNSAFEMAVLYGLCKITDNNGTKENMRGLIRRITNGKVKTSSYKILNEHIFEELESCGYYIYNNGNKEMIN
jgi:hypothetical protein